jgi:Fe-S cluster assembly protein SufD
MAVNASDRALASYVEAFDTQRAALPGARAPAIRALRAGAIARFAERGFPTLRDEAWKYTNLARIARGAFPTGEAAEIDASALAPFRLDGPSHRLVFVNGRFAPALSDLGAVPQGAAVMPLAEALERDDDGLAGELEDDRDGLAALNTALMRDGLCLRLGPGVVLDRPVELVHFAVAEAAPVGSHPRSLIVLAPESEAAVVETYTGAGAAAYWTNAATEIVVGRGARLRHARVQAESPRGFHVGRLRARLDGGADYSAAVLSTGASLARNEMAVRLAGDGARCELRGGALVRDRQHGDVTTEVEHARPNGTSRQLFKNVVDDGARAVYQGRIVVERAAQKTDAHQTSRNLLLSRGGQADTKPELRILADDVKCSHGTSVGELDREALFYLRSRGVPMAAARSLLIEAFVAEIADGMPAALAAPLRRTIAAWLGAGGARGDAA